MNGKDSRVRGFKGSSGLSKAKSSRISDFKIGVNHSRIHISLSLLSLNSELESLIISNITLILK